MIVIISVGRPLALTLGDWYDSEQKISQYYETERIESGCQILSSGQIRNKYPPQSTRPFASPTVQVDKHKFGHRFRYFPASRQSLLYGSSPRRGGEVRSIERARRSRWGSSSSGENRMSFVRLRRLHATQN